MTCFVDTSAILALLQRGSEQHDPATRTWQQLRASRAALFTTNYVVVETVALLQARCGLGEVRMFQELFAPLLDVVWVGPHLHATGLAALMAEQRRRLSLVDCISFEVIDQTRPDRVFAFDRHFAERGYCMA
jgi:predicted nucleic acid-binding protein